VNAPEPTFGPVQMLVLEFDRTKFDGEIMPELARLKDAGIIRLIDLLFVRKPVGGDLEVVQTSDLSEDEATDFGALVGALIGLGSGDEELSYRTAVAGAEELEDGHFFGDSEVWYLADAIPEVGLSATVMFPTARSCRGLAPGTVPSLNEAIGEKIVDVKPEIARTRQWYVPPGNAKPLGCNDVKFEPGKFVFVNV